MTDTKILHELAKVYAASYASPHHITFTLDGLRHLVAALALPDEPVAWNISYTSADGSIRTVTHGHNAIADYRQIDQNAISTPLYAAPQTAEPKAAPVERKPLSSEAVFDLALDEIARTTDVVDLAFNLIRATEAKHGIQGAA